MVTIAIRALELEYLVKILDWRRSRYILPPPTPPTNSFRLRLHLIFLPTPTPQPCLEGMEQEGGWIIEVDLDVMKQKPPPGSESHVSSPYGH
jgi:hypothetical protein